MWTLGWDPGLKETGMCLLDPTGEAVVAATIKAEGPDVPDLQRIFRLAKAAVREAIRWRAKMPAGAELLHSIEYPIMKASNVTNYRKQVNTLYAIEHELLEHGVGHYLGEVSPSASKLMGVGCGAAIKRQIVAASPFEGSGHTVETMADAWLHATFGHIQAKEKERRTWINIGAIETFPYNIEAREDLV
jgi:hypothetical protein